jgi:hypothetical protein
MNPNTIRTAVTATGGIAVAATGTSATIVAVGTGVAIIGAGLLIVYAATEGYRALAPASPKRKALRKRGR